MDGQSELVQRIAELEALVAEQAERIAELEDELRRRGKRYRPQANSKP